MAARRVFSLSFAVTKITGVLPPRRDNDVDEGNCAPVYLGWTVSCAMVAQAIALVRLGRKQEAIAVLARIRRRRSDGARDVLGGLGGGLVQSALAAEIRSALREADSVPANVAMM
jgi:hypothetical protein